MKTRPATAGTQCCAWPRMLLGEHPGDSRDPVQWPRGPVAAACPCEINGEAEDEKERREWRLKLFGLICTKGFSVPASLDHHNPNSSRRREISCNAASRSPSGCRSCHSITIVVALPIHGPFLAPRLFMISAPFTIGFSSHTATRSFSTMYVANPSNSRATRLRSVSQIKEDGW